MKNSAVLIESVRQGKPVNNGSYLVNSTRLAVMGQIACYTGTETNWDAVMQSQMQFGPAPDGVNFQTPPPSVPDETGNYPLPMPGITKLL